MRLQRAVKGVIGSVAATARTCVECDRRPRTRARIGRRRYSHGGLHQRCEKRDEDRRARRD